MSDCLLRICVSAYWGKETTALVILLAPKDYKKCPNNMLIAIPALGYLSVE